MRALLCGLLALAQVLAFSHAALVEHRTCALHGESMHTGAVTASPDIVGERQLASSIASDTAAHGHEHCLCMAQARERFLSGSPVLAAATTPPVAPGPAVAPAVACAPAIALLSIAPKSSPPA